jgi:hypothetical protein
MPVDLEQQDLVAESMSREDPLDVGGESRQEGTELVPTLALAGGPPAGSGHESGTEEAMEADALAPARPALPTSAIRSEEAEEAVIVQKEEEQPEEDGSPKLRPGPLSPAASTASPSTPHHPLASDDSMLQLEGDLSQ